MDPAAAGLIGGAIGVVGALVGSVLLDHAQTRRWRVDADTRRRREQDDAVAHYLAAVGTWRSQLSRLWQHRTGGSDLDRTVFDAAAGEFYLRRFAAELLIDRSLREMLHGQRKQLEALFLLAADGCGASEWTQHWEAIDASCGAIVDEVRQMTGVDTVSALRLGPHSTI